ncbi:hypothetical protein GCM10010191_12220 [Actinomadura vinacea]|uniref:Uncharacterized protein n=1 Tax=Actinomadura vinacea TaxID=115336 RepID=A0ABN3IKH8_9ACTN
MVIDAVQPFLVQAEEVPVVPEQDRPKGDGGRAQPREDHPDPHAQPPPPCGPSARIATHVPQARRGRGRGGSLRHPLKPPGPRRHQHRGRRQNSLGPTLQRRQRIIDVGPAQLDQALIPNLVGGWVGGRRFGVGWCCVLFGRGRDVQDGIDVRGEGGCHCGVGRPDENRAPAAGGRLAHQFDVVPADGGDHDQAGALRGERADGVAGHLGRHHRAETRCHVDADDGAGQYLRRRRVTERSLDHPAPAGQRGERRQCPQRSAL